MYWDLIERSQTQAAFLLDMPLSTEKREMVSAFVTIMDKPMLKRWQLLRQYGLKKNKAFHTLVFTTLIISKFAYRRK
jgi:rhamnosyltransferase